MPTERDDTAVLLINLGTPKEPNTFEVIQATKLTVFRPSFHLSLVTQELIQLNKLINKLISIFREKCSREALW